MRDERRRLAIRGEVQGVYFRETVRRIAHRYAVAGFVRNVGTDTVEIEAEGPPSAVNAFVADVLAHPPPRARVADVESSPLPAQGAEGFHVAPTVRPPVAESG